MNRVDLIKELRYLRDNEEVLTSKDRLALDKAVDVLVSAYRILTPVNSFTIGGVLVEFGVDKETGILFCGKTGDTMLPVVQNDVDNAVRVLQNIHRNVQEKLKKV